MTARHGKTLTIAIAAGIGLASGLLSYLVPEAFDQAGIESQNAVVAWLLRLWPGIIYGVAIGLYLVNVDLATWRGAAVFVPLDTVAWYVAYWFASDGADTLGLPLKELWQLGIASGLIGASLVALSALILFPFFRRWYLVAVMIVVGGVAGILLMFGTEDMALVTLFALWQAAIAACFGWGVVRAQEES